MQLTEQAPVDTAAVETRDLVYLFASIGARLDGHIIQAAAQHIRDIGVIALFQHFIITVGQQHAVHDRCKRKAESIPNDTGISLNRPSISC